MVVFGAAAATSCAFATGAAAGAFNSMGGTRESADSPLRSTSTKIRLREARTRCCDGRASPTRMRATGAPSGAVARITCNTRWDTWAARMSKLAGQALGAGVPQIDEHRERIGLAGQVRCSTDSIQTVLTPPSSRPEMDRTAGPSVGGGPLAVSVTARAAATGTARHQLRVATAHHLFSLHHEETSALRAASRSDNGFVDLLLGRSRPVPGDGPDNAVGQGIARLHGVDLAVRTRDHRDPDALGLNDAAHGEFVGADAGQALRPRVGALDAPLLAGLAD